MATILRTFCLTILIAATCTFARHRRHLSHKCTAEQIMGMPGIGEAILSVLGAGAKLLHNHPTTTTAQIAENRESCEKGPIVDIKSDMSLELRSICAAEKVNNYDSRRLPAHIPEMRCRCATPRNSALLPKSHAEQLRCEPIVHEQRFIKFDAECKTFELGVAQVAVACTAAMKSHSRSDLEFMEGQPIKENVEDIV